MTAPRPRRQSIQVLASAGLVVVALCAVGYQLLHSDELPAWSYPELEPIEGPRVDSHPPPLATGEPLAVEILLEPQAVLVLGDSKGREVLSVHSHQGRSPADCRVELTGGAEEGATYELAGAAELGGLTRGWHRLAVDGPGGLRVERAVRLPRSRPLDIDWSLRVPVAGAVFAHAGEPLVGAQLEIAGRTGRSDSGGRFRIEDVVAGADVPVRVAAPGHGAYQEVVSIVRDADLRFVLPEGQRIVGLLQMPVEEIVLARVSVLPESSEPQGTHAFPFDWRGRFTDVAVGPDGRFEIDGVPAGLAVCLGVLHPRFALEAPVAVGPPERPGRPARAYLAPRAAPVLRGQVVGDDGQPLPGAVLTTSPPGRDAGRTWGAGYFGENRPALLPGHAAAMGGTLARSSPDGSFAIGLPFRRTLVRVAAVGCDGQEEVFPQRGRQLHRFTLLPATASTRDPPRLVVRFVRRAGEPLRPLRVQLKWGEKAMGASFLHDPTLPLELPALRRPGIVGVRIRRLGSGSVSAQEEARVVGRTEVILAL